MNYSLCDFENDIREIISLCNKDLFALSIGESRQATKEQIVETIIPEMNNLLEMIKNNDVPVENQRWILSTAYITRGWNWDIQNCGELAKKLAQLDNNYRYKLSL